MMTWHMNMSEFSCSAFAFFVEGLEAKGPRSKSSSNHFRLATWYQFRWHAESILILKVRFESVFNLDPKYPSFERGSANSVEIPLLVFSDVSCAWHETIKSCYPRKSYPRCVNSLLVLTPWNHQCQNVHSAQPNDQLSLPQSAAQSIFFHHIGGTSGWRFWCLARHLYNWCPAFRMLDPSGCIVIGFLLSGWVGSVSRSLYFKTRLSVPCRLD